MRTQLHSASETEPDSDPSPGKIHSIMNDGYDHNLFAMHGEQLFYSLPFVPGSNYHHDVDRSASYSLLHHLTICQYAPMQLLSCDVQNHKPGDPFPGIWQ